MAAKKFKARLEKGDRALGWTIARVPFEPGKVWKGMVRLRVRGDVNGFEFRTSLFPDAERGGFFLLVNKAMQKSADVGLGEEAEFRLEPDLEERPAEIHEGLAALLDEEPELREFYESFSENKRREMGKWITVVKSEEAQLKRVEELAERLMGTMEGEKELPPVVVAAFKRRPKAKAGWAKLTPLQRRGELMAVLYYKSPESRLKRVEKLCDLAETKA
ncbi:MAG: YdeI/OmpD-associated family protein [Acidobacteriota bacterium]